MHKLSQKKFKSAQNERLCGIEHCTPAIHFEMRRERQSIQSFIHWKVQLLKRKDKEEDGETLRKFSHLLVSASFFLMLMMILMILPYFCVHRVHNCRINKTILNIFLIEILNALLSFSFIVSQIRFLLLPLIPGSMPSSFFYFYCSRWNFLSFYRFFFSSVSVLFFISFSSRFYFSSLFLLSQSTLHTNSFYLYFYRATRDECIIWYRMCFIRRGSQAEINGKRNFFSYSAVVGVSICWIPKILGRVKCPRNMWLVFGNLRDA